MRPDGELDVGELQAMAWKLPKRQFGDSVQWLGLFTLSPRAE
jgi:hypothetical protein